jgi:hypothetical protein
MRMPKVELNICLHEKFKEVQSVASPTSFLASSAKAQQIS